MEEGKETEDIFSEIIRSGDTQSGMYWYALAETRIDNNKKDIDTLIALENSLKFGGLPPYAEARSNALLACMYHDRDKKVEARDYFKKALQINDGNEDTFREFDPELYALACRECGMNATGDEAIRLLEIPIELGYDNGYAYFEYYLLARYYDESADNLSMDLDARIYKLEKSIDYLMKAKDTAPYEEWAQQTRSTISERRNKIENLKHPEMEIRSNPEKRKQAEKKLSNLKFEITSLTKERHKMFSELGERAYSKCTDNMPDLDPVSQSKIQAILSVETLICEKNEDMKNDTNKEKKSGFFAKLGSAVSSTAKQGKLKVDVYNLQKKKSDATTDFGESLWNSHQKGNDYVEEISDIFLKIDKIEQEIIRIEGEINNLNKILY